MEEGIFPAKIIGFVDLGTQLNDKKNTYSKYLLIMFQVFDESSQSHLLSKKYTALYKRFKGGSSNLYKDFNSFMPSKDVFDSSIIIGAHCLVTLKKVKDKDSLYVDSIARAKEDMKLPVVNFQPIIYEMEDGKFKYIPDNVPNWAKNIIFNSEEYKEYKNNKEKKEAETHGR